MSINSEITRLQTAKANLKSAIENNLGVTVSSSAKLDTYDDLINSYGTYPSKPSNTGVYIKYSDGTYSNSDLLVSGKTPVGVALITSNVSILIYPNGVVNNLKYGTNALLVSGVVTTTDSSAASSDFAGKANTDALLSAEGSNAQQAYWARNTCTYADGSIGFLPSLGQALEIKMNISPINVALGLLGGTTIPTDKGINSSTQQNSERHWIVGANGIASNSYKTEYVANRYTVSVATI